MPLKINKKLIAAAIIFLIAIGIGVLSYKQYKENQIKAYCIDKCELNDNQSLRYLGNNVKINCWNNCRIEYNVNKNN